MCYWTENISKHNDSAGNTYPWTVYSNQNTVNRSVTTNSQQ